MFSNDNDVVLIRDARADWIHHLVSFCRGEMSAVETYRLTIHATGKTWLLKQLRRNLASHEHRVLMLRQRILQLDGAPPASSGPWGTFANVVEGVASAISENAALSILEEGERHGVTVYQRDLHNLDEASQRLVSEQVLPRQIETRNALEDLRRAMAA
jgi:hypothetical protein